MPQTPEGVGSPGEQHRGAVALADARRAHAGHQDSAAGIDEQLALDAADFLAAVVPVQAAALTGPDALTVHDGRAATGITADLHPLALAQRRQHPLPTPSCCHRRQ